ncbi:hypothetical protein [Trichocoleus sp. FACHB-262]|nr:hypothetical protein [Trichocoleus sp. FACHB-262]
MGQVTPFGALVRLVEDGIQHRTQADFSEFTHGFLWRQYSVS